MNISRGLISRPQKCVIYGAEGIGKTTLASKFPNPLFIDTEGGTAQLDVMRTEPPKTWNDLISLVDEIAVSRDICDTVVLDTADWAEIKCINAICEKFKLNGIEDLGYGKGYVYVSENFEKLLKAFDKCIESGKNVVITAHAKMRKFEQPDELGAYDRWEMKLSKQVAPLIKEWTDLMLFCNYKTYIVEDTTKTKKAQGGKRVMYAAHHPCWDAKNRHGLPDMMEMSYDSIAHIFMKSEQKVVKEEPKPENTVIEIPDRPIMKLAKLMTADGITDEQIRLLVSKKGKYPFETPIVEYPDSFITDWILPRWDKIVILFNTTKN